jgi:gas vesicle protein
MREKTLLAFLGGLTVGGIAGILFAPMQGNQLRALRAKHDDNEDRGIHNFSISELTSENSTSLEEIRKHLQD